MNTDNTLFRTVLNCILEITSSAGFSVFKQYFNDFLFSL